MRTGPYRLEFWWLDGLKSRAFAAWHGIEVR